MVSSTTGNTASRFLFSTNQHNGEIDVNEWMESINLSNEPNVEERSEIAKDNIDKLQQYNKQYFDKKVVKKKHFEKADLVVIKGRKMVGKLSILHENSKVHTK